LTTRRPRAVDLKADIWTVADCAAFLRQHPDTFRKVTRYKPGFPAPLAHLGEHCWAAHEVRSWALPPPIPRRDAKPLKIREV